MVKHSHEESVTQTSCLPTEASYARSSRAAPGGFKVPLLVIVGPTAVGKTELSIEVAERLAGEIVSGDSAQVYRHMDLGTAKPTAAQRLRVAHHLLDIVDPEEDYNVARFQRDAAESIAQIAGRGRLPLLVGGTGLYVQAVVDGLSLPAAPPDPVFREQMRDRAAREGADSLHRQLKLVDPVSAVRIHPNDLKRVIRALEVFHLTGSPLSSFQTTGMAPPTDTGMCLDQSTSSRYNAAIVGVFRSRQSLYSRIEHRIDAMLSAGFLEEVQHLKRRGCHLGMTSMQSLGYRHGLLYLNGEISFDTLTTLWKRDTRRFAKRQFTWFGRDRRVNWFDLESMEQEEVVTRILDLARHVVDTSSQ
ncbi:MAG: tRNA (adenosine(37)-N6)-dimethylallyltransferase MiaA [Armatimonadetes bacterium]|nr:tRNA (adenosine(37)-N6)-dimethylallyltransferase MiaA [Armatimonadota bacterium]